MKSWLCFCVFVFLCCYTGFCQNDQKKQDLLNKLVESKPNVDRLDILYELAKLTQSDPPDQIKYIDQLLQEAEKQNNNIYMCEAYSFYMFYAYNQYNPDDVNKWMKLLEPLARQEKLYDLLFRGKQCVVDMLLLSEEYELEEKEALLMLREAQELNNITGQISACHSLSHVYIATYRNDKASQMLEEAISLGRLSDNLWLSVEVLRSMIQFCEERKDFSNWFKYQEKLDSVTICLERVNSAEFIKKDHMLNYISYLKYYASLKKWNQAESYLKLAESVHSEEYHVVYQHYYLTARTFYFMQVGDWHRAMEENAKVLPIIQPLSEVYYLKELSLKAKLLNLIGNEKEALGLYKKTKSLKDSLQLTVINKQAEQVKKFYTADVQTLDWETQQQQLQSIFLVLAGGITLVLIISIFHAYKIKGKLTKAEQEMREMVNEIERANQVKEYFLSNINLAIRPSLNSIVEHSIRLTSEEEISPEERTNLGKIVTSTADDLMKMINDILLLSKLEAKMMKFTIAEVDFCQELRALIEMTRQMKSVRIDIPDNAPVVLDCDERYLRQVFESLLEKSFDNREEMVIRLEICELSMIRVEVVNTILAKSDPSQNIAIRNEINRILMECFGGKYTICSQQNMPCILIEFNLKK